MVKNRFRKECLEKVPRTVVIRGEYTILNHKALSSVYTDST